jgi:hypothetical protein
MGDISFRIIPPDGYEMYFDDGVAKFREIKRTPALATAMSASPVGYAYEWYDPSKKTWASTTGNSRPDASNPSIRNIRFNRPIYIALAHPDEQYVNEATDLLQDYLDTHLPDIVAERIEVLD